MGISTSKGLVLHKSCYSNTSLIITALTPDHGILRMMGRGYRRPPKRSSTLREPIELFSEMEFGVYWSSSSDLHNATASASMESFSELRSSVDRFCAAGFGASLALSVSGGSSPSEYANLRNFWRALCAGLPVATSLLKFWLKHLSIAGFLPSLDRCGECGGPFEGGTWFGEGEESLLCPSCGSGRTLAGPMPGDLKSAAHLVREPYMDTKLRLNPGTRRSLARFLTVLTTAQLGHPPRLIDRVRKICDNHQ